MRRQRREKAEDVCVRECDAPTRRSQGARRHGGDRTRLARIVDVTNVCAIVLGVVLGAGCSVTPADRQEHVAAAPSLHEIRVGVELIAAPPDAIAQDGQGRGETSADAPGPPPPFARPRYPTSPPPLDADGARPLSRRQIDALPTTTERFTFRMLHTLVGADGDRLPRELGWSFLLRQMDAVDLANIDPWAEDLDAQDAAALQKIAPDLVSKSVRRALRELPLVRDVELWFQDFKVESLPLSGTWLDGRDEERRELGHLSLRLRSGRDPLQMTYSVQGWRLGVSRDTVRTGFSTPLSDDITLAITSSFNHARDTYDAMAELKFALNARTRLLFTFGNQLHVFPGPALEQFAHEELEGATGAMMYLETIF